MENFNLNGNANLIFRVENNMYKLSIDIEQGFLHLYKFYQEDNGVIGEELQHIYDIIPFSEPKKPEPEPEAVLELPPVLKPNHNKKRRKKKKK